jgi:NAD(P)H dehydrogenase (quinone)
MKQMDQTKGEVPRLAVTGATGELGGRVAARLAKLGVSQRLVVRDPKRAPQLPGAEVVQASSYGDAAGIGRALAGVETLFLVSAHDAMTFAQRSTTGIVGSYDRVKQQTTAIDAAVAVGIQRIVYLSFISAAADATFLLAREHFHTEEHIRATGVSFTFLRMTLYMDLVPLHISILGAGKVGGIIRGPAGLGRAAWVARDDLADVAAAVLTGEGHDGHTYDVTGPDAITMAETAEQLSAVSGRQIDYEAQTPHEARTLRNTSGMYEFEARRRAQMGVTFTEYEVEEWITHFMQIATGEMGIVSDTVPKLTGHEAQTFIEFLRKNPESYTDKPWYTGSLVEGYDYR